MLDHQSIALFFNCYDFMTPKEKKIAEVLSDFWLAKTTSINKKSKIYPSIATLARKSGCSSRTINRFQKKFGFLFTKVKGRYLWANKINDPKYEIDRQGRFLANEYNLDGGFFEIVAFLKYKKITKHWKKVRLSIVNNVNQNQELTLFIMGFKTWVINIKMSHGSSEKCRTISCIPFSTKKNKDYKVPSAYAGSSALILDYGFNKEILRYADLYCPYSVVKDARNDYDWFEKSNPVYCPNGLMLDLLRKQQNRYTLLASKHFKRK